MFSDDDADDFSSFVKEALENKDFTEGAFNVSKVVIEALGEYFNSDENGQAYTNPNMVCAGLGFAIARLACQPSDEGDRGMAMVFALESAGLAYEWNMENNPHAGTVHDEEVH